MPSDADLALVGATGVAYTAPVGTAAPLGFAALAATWKELGYISQDGLTGAVSEERQTWTPWGQLSPIRTQVTSSTKTFAITAWETNPVILGLYYKAADADLVPDSTTNVITFAESDRPAPDRRAFLFDIADGLNLMRIYIPEGEVTEKGDVVYKSDDLVGYPLTMSAYPDGAGHSTYRSFKLAALA